jgi:HIRAN domain
MARRISITKLQRRTAAAVELIALCQTMTADGRLADDEIVAFKQWLTDNEHIDLPAKDFLALTVTKILSDATVTDEERDDLYAAIETALPLDIRADVRGRRRTRQDADREQRRIERDAARVAAREARLRDTPLETWDFMVAGSLYEGRPAVIERYARIGDPVYLARDPANRFSANAIEIRLPNGMQIGFVPETDARDMARELDSGCPHRAYLKKILAGRRAPIPVVVASLYHPEAAQLPGCVLQHQVPAKASPAATAHDRSAAASHWLLYVAVAAAIVILVLAIWALR